MVNSKILAIHFLGGTSSQSKPAAYFDNRHQFLWQLHLRRTLVNLFFMASQASLFFMRQYINSIISVKKEQRIAINIYSK
jgi:hypothetical protein